MLSTEAACKGESPMAQVYEEFQQELEGSKAILTALLLNLTEIPAKLAKSRSNIQSASNYTQWRRFRTASFLSLAIDPN